jgi:hypothetical protein
MEARGKNVSYPKKREANLSENLIHIICLTIKNYFGEQILPQFEQENRRSSFHVFAIKKII